MAGHSLGGAMAGVYVNKTNNDIDGLIYLSAHITNEINVPVLSIRGTNDNYKSGKLSGGQINGQE